MKDEKASFYGFKCVAVGYEFNPGVDEVMDALHLKRLLLQRLATRVMPVVPAFLGDHPVGERVGLSGKCMCCSSNEERPGSPHW